MELKAIIQEIDQLRIALDRHRPFNESKINRLQQKVKLQWNYHSNRIEGNTLTESETKTFLLNGITAGGKPFRDYLEMKGHNEAINKLYRLIDKELSITETLIKDFHQMILVEVFRDEYAEINPGEWKTRNNYLYSSTGERIDFAPADEVPQLMNELINWVNNQMSPPKRKKDKYNLHPLLIASTFHVRFIDIHPFGDGNGRMARILSNVILMVCGYVPFVVPSDTKDKYYLALNNSSADQPTSIATYFGQLLIQAMQETLAAVTGSGLEDMDSINESLKDINEQLN
ncbi:MAG: Fic family protein [Bacteroidota bacterium]